MVERNETPWAFRPPESAKNREKAVAIAKAKSVSFNALVASYVVKGIERDWARLNTARLQGDLDRVAKNGGGMIHASGPVLQRSDVSPNLKGKKS